jgi:hypothetical protein
MSPPIRAKKYGTTTKSARTMNIGASISLHMKTISIRKKPYQSREAKCVTSIDAVRVKKASGDTDRNVEVQTCFHNSTRKPDLSLSQILSSIDSLQTLQAANSVSKFLRRQVPMPNIALLDIWAFRCELFAEAQQQWLQMQYLSREVSR